MNEMIDEIKIMKCGNKQYRTFWGVCIKYEVRNTNGGLLCGTNSLDDAFEKAHKFQEEYKHDKLNSDLIVFIEELEE